MTPQTPPTPTEPGHTRVAIVGTGFAGLGAAIALQRAGVPFIIFERAAAVGGTWRDNAYPGCMCDVPSHLYSFSFAPNPDWTRTYSPQPEIFAYLRRTAEEHGVLQHIRFDHEVKDATWDGEAQQWLLDTAGGTYRADVLILGHGPLSEPALPLIPGLDTFEGTCFHSAQWDADHDLTGERVAVIGTGASAIQFIPEIQPVADRVTVFQRTPPWVLPHRDRPTTRFERTLYRRFPAAQRAVRAFVYWARELAVLGMLRDSRLTAGTEKLARTHLAKQVPDPVQRARLTPSYRPGCKRLLLSNSYYPALQQPNVDVVTEPIVEVRPHAVVTSDGTEHEVDTIIFGTGFRVTDHPIADRIHGTGGTSLAERWAGAGMGAYKGTTVPGFPNLFLLAGPNTGIGHTSLVVMIEAQVAYIADALRLMDERGIGAVDVRPTAWADWQDAVQARLAPTVWNAGGCASWYLDATGRNTSIWPDHTFRFRRLTRRFDPSRYELAGKLAPASADMAGAVR